jgi:hypothetical protein
VGLRQALDEDISRNAWWKCPLENIAPGANRAPLPCQSPRRVEGRDHSVQTDRFHLPIRLVLFEGNDLLPLYPNCANFIKELVE